MHCVIIAVLLCMYGVLDAMFPIFLSLSLSLSLLLYPTGLVSYNNALFLYRFFYPFILLSLLATIVVLIIIKQCKRLYRHVRNEK